MMVDGCIWYRNGKVWEITAMENMVPKKVDG